MTLPESGNEQSWKTDLNFAKIIVEMKFTKGAICGAKILLSKVVLLITGEMMANILEMVVAPVAAFGSSQRRCLAMANYL